jgi:hypothetical protein
MLSERGRLGSCVRKEGSLFRASNGTEIYKPLCLKSPPNHMDVCALTAALPLFCCSMFNVTYDQGEPAVKVETPIHDSIRELVSFECKEHGAKS